MSHRSAVPVALGIALWLTPTGARAQGTELQRAQMAIAGLDITSADIVAYCVSGGPAAVAPLRTAWQAWRTRAAVDDITRQMDATLLQKTRDGMTKVTESARQRLAGAGQPATVCPQLASMWSSADFDVRTKFAVAYAPAPAASTTAVASAGGGTPTAGPATTSGRNFNPRSYYEITRPTGTVYSIAQLDALDDQWRGKPYNYDRAMDAMKAAGIIFMRGLVIKRGDSFFVVTRDSTFDSKLVVSPSVNVEAFEGQVITVAGRLESLPMSVVFLRGGGVVRDPSALVPSTLPSASGMRRRGVTVEEVTAAAGRGLKPTEIEGVLYNGEGRIGATGNYEFHEETTLFLKDGWAYTRDDVPPTDLDVAKSRRIEPQAWARWRRNGAGYEMQSQDDYGRLSGTWGRRPGRLIDGWGATHTITGYYSSQAFYGSAALGGTFVRNSWLFKADGRWERSGYTQSGSGTMAAQQPVGFSSSAVSVSDGRGTRSVAGGGTADVHASSQSTKDDGARNRGTYRLDGMVLEMRSDAGEVWRTFCVPINDKTIYMNGTSYSMK